MNQKSGRWFPTLGYVDVIFHYTGKKEIAEHHTSRVNKHIEKHPEEGTRLQAWLAAQKFPV